MKINNLKKIFTKDLSTLSIVFIVIWGCR